jgi:hypothetical protein
MDNSEEGKTVTDYVREILRRDLALPSWRQWVARVQSRPPVDVQAIEVLDAGRADREDELSRTGA